MTSPCEAFSSVSLDLSDSYTYTYIHLFDYSVRKVLVNLVIRVIIFLIISASILASAESFIRSQNTLGMADPVTQIRQLSVSGHT